MFCAVPGEAVENVVDQSRWWGEIAVCGQHGLNIIVDGQDEVL
jgi:hypothetical protein